MFFFENKPLPTFSRKIIQKLIVDTVNRRCITGNVQHSNSSVDLELTILEGFVMTFSEKLLLNNKDIQKSEY